MKPNLIVCGLVASAALFFAGCETTPPDTGAYVPVNTTVNDRENHESIVLLDPRVQTSVTCTGIQQKLTEDGRLDIVANIRNRENRRVQVQIGCVFKDAQGYPTQGDDSTFHNLILPENGQESAHFTALNDKAKRYTLRIREAH